MPNKTHAWDKKLGRRRVTTLCAGGRTKQEFKDECDINQILKQWIKTGQAPYMATPAEYGDFSVVTDFRESIELVTKTKQQFAALPSHLRDRFGNSPNQMLSFLEDNENMEEAIKLGIVQGPDFVLDPEPPNNSPEPKGEKSKTVPTEKPAGGETAPD